MTFGLFVPSRFASSIMVAGDGEEEEDDDDGALSKSRNKNKMDCIPALYFLSGLTCDGRSMCGV